MSHTLTINKTAINREAVRAITSLLLCFVLLAVCLTCTAQTAYCSEETTPPAEDVASTLTGAFSNVTTEIYTIMRQVVAPICILVFAAAGFQFLVGGNQGTEKARKLMFGGLIGVVLVVFAPVIVNTIAGAFAANGTGDLNDYNPLL